jgi:hypothetical protein
VAIDLDLPIDDLDFERFVDQSRRLVQGVQCGGEQLPLDRLRPIGDDDHQTLVDLRLRIQPAEVADVVGPEGEPAVVNLRHQVPVLTAAPAAVGHAGGQ